MRSLTGKIIALPESRELDKLSSMLEAEGAQTLRCPLISILDAADPVPLLKWLGELARGQFTDVIFLTGEGVRRLWTVACKHKIDAGVHQGLARVRKITRGPKPARALHDMGLAPDLSPSPPTSAGIIAHFEGARAELSGRIFGVQLFGDDPGTALVEFLAANEARVMTVSPYTYAPATDDERVVELIEAIINLRVDAVAFTTAPQVERLWQVAERRQLRAALDAALPKLVVAAVGPVVASALKDRGHTPGVVPSPQFFMRRLTEALVGALGPATQKP
ncbi:MAG: uroporphyrinogen-III synthase [Deltaproteobacteria bacterium]|nr:uroporphyrinogen-III synthase [Deltaproteobacteria bacterium]